MRHIDPFNGNSTSGDRSCFQAAKFYTLPRLCPSSFCSLVLKNGSSGWVPVILSFSIDSSSSGSRGIPVLLHRQFANRIAQAVDGEHVSQPATGAHRPGPHPGGGPPLQLPPQLQPQVTIPESARALHANFLTSTRTTWLSSRTVPAQQLQSQARLHRLVCCCP
jgi:hypothetical protein